MNMNNILNICIDKCDRGWIDQSRRHYGDISDIVEVSDMAVKHRVLALCEVGMATVSPRFAYPHIREILVKNRSQLKGI